MTRKKVKLTWIENDGARRASFRKRRAGLLKKVSELSILCGVDASVVIYSPDEIEPTVWPSHDVVEEQFTKFKSMPELERMKKMSNHDTYLRDRVSKSHEQLSRTQRRNKESDMNDLMRQIQQGKGLHECNLWELNGLTWFFDEKMKEINRRIEFHRRLPYAPGTAAPPPSQGLAVADKATWLGAGGTGNSGLQGDHGSTPTESLLLDQWFMEMMKNKALKGAGSSSSTRSDMGYPCHLFTAVTTADDHMGLPRHSFGGSSSTIAGAHDMELGLGLSPCKFKGPPIDMGLPPFIPHGHCGSTDMGLQPSRISVGGNNFGSFGTNIGLGLGLNRFNGHIGSSSAGLAPLGLSGSCSNSTGNDTGVPSDGQTEPENSA